MKNRKNYLKSRKKNFKWKLIGWYSDSECRKCGKKAILQIEKYDSWCCITCNEWLDDVCGDPDCPFCSKRPETPYEAYYYLTEIKKDGAYRKNWRRENYQHKTDGMKRHKKQREFIENILNN